MNLEERSHRIRQIVSRLNDIAQERKEKLDRVWIKAKRLKEPDAEILTCLDELWQLENETQPLRVELIKLVEGKNGRNTK